MKNRVVKIIMVLAACPFLRRGTLLISASILSFGISSCHQKKSNDTKGLKDSSTQNDSVVTTCYEPVPNDSSSNNNKGTFDRKRNEVADTLQNIDKPVPPVMCYAPMPPKKD